MTRYSKTGIDDKYINITTKDGRYALDFAREKGFNEIVKFIEQYKKRKAQTTAQRDIRHAICDILLLEVVGDPGPGSGSGLGDEAARGEEGLLGTLVGHDPPEHAERGRHGRIADKFLQGFDMA